MTSKRGAARRKNRKSHEINTAYGILYLSITKLDATKNQNDLMIYRF